MKKSLMLLPMLLLVSCGGQDVNSSPIVEETAKKTESYPKNKTEYQECRLNYVFESIGNNEYTAIKTTDVNKEIADKIADLDFEIRNEETYLAPYELRDGGYDIKWYCFTFFKDNSYDRRIKFKDGQVQIYDRNLNSYYFQGDMSEKANKTWNELKPKIDVIIDSCERETIFC